MKEYYEIREMLCKELKEYARKRELSESSLDVIVKLLKGIKNSYEIEMLEEYDDYDEESYEGGGSYARGRGRNAKRDRMGRYSRDGEGGGYGRDNGMMYSRDNGMDHFKNTIREMMNYAKNDQEREAYRRVMRELDNE